MSVRQRWVHYQPPVFASDRSAARLLDLTPGEFRSLVGRGVLPLPLDIGGFKRWDVRALVQIADGHSAEGFDDALW